MERDTFRPRERSEQEKQIWDLEQQLAETRTMCLELREKTEDLTTRLGTERIERIKAEAKAAARDEVMNVVIDRFFGGRSK